MNLDEDHNDPANELKPPPKMSDMMTKRESVTNPEQNPLASSNQPMSLGSAQPTILSQPISLGSQPTSLPTLNSTADDANLLKSSQTNMFKLQRGRSM